VQDKVFTPETEFDCLGSSFLDTDLFVGSFFLNDGANLPNPFAGRNALVFLSSVFLHTQQLLLLLCECSVNSLILCLFGLFAVSVSSFDLLEILFDLSLSPSLHLPLTDGSTSLSLSLSLSHTHTHTHTEAHTNRRGLVHLNLVCSEVSSWVFHRFQQH
jgi:hypothetical protein